jgi:GNAT superfamily N-acetyltransferase
MKMKAQTEPLIPNQISVKSYTWDTLKEGALICRKNRLFSSYHQSLSSLFIGLCNDEIYQEEKIIITILSLNNIPIGVCTFDDFLIQCFVRKSERRKGYGTILYRNLLERAIEFEFINDKQYVYHGTTKDGVYLWNKFDKIKNELKEEKKNEYILQTYEKCYTIVT